MDLMFRPKCHVLVNREGSQKVYKDVVWAREFSYEMRLAGLGLVSFMYSLWKVRIQMCKIMRRLDRMNLLSLFPRAERSIVEGNILRTLF